MARTILITGCSSGIGHDAAKRLAARGWRVFATCRQEADCERLRGEGLESFRLDYAEEASIEAAMAEAAGRSGGKIDALFNNGAFACPGLMEDVPRDAMREIFEVNVFGYHDLTRRVIPLMRAHGGGRIVNCSSILGLVGAEWRGAYVATKFALEGMTDVLRLELRGTGIFPILIEPGPIRTKFRANARAHFEQWIDWEHAARRADYRAQVGRLNDSHSRDAFELGPEAVTKVLIRAIEARRPKARYGVTVPTHAVRVMKRLFPTPALDWVVSRG